MVLSGYLMMLTWRQCSRDFYIRRIFRIVPVYYCALACIFFLSDAHADGRSYLLSRNPSIPAHVYGLYYPPLDWKSWLLHISFLFGLAPNYSASIGLPDWSLSLEMQFYLVFPLIAPALRNGKTLSILAVGGILLREISIRCLNWREPSLLSYNLSLFLIGMFACSAVAGLCGKRDATVPREMPGVVHLGICMILIASLREPVQCNVILMIVAVMLTAACVPSANRYANNILGCKLARFIGGCSYAVYLFHGLVISLMGPFVYRFGDQFGLSPCFRVGILLLVVLLITFPIAWAIHVCIELPFIRLGKSIVGTLP